MVLRLSLFFLFALTLNSTAHSQFFYKTLDSIQQLRALSDDESLSLNKRKDYAKKAYDLSYKTNLDSLVLKSGFDLAFLYVISNDLDSHLIQHQKNLKLADKLNDLKKIAYVSANLGWNHNVTEKHIDSAYYYYYKSLNNYKRIGDKYSQASVLINISNLLRHEKDYFRAEINTVEAIKIINSIDNKDTLDSEDILDNFHTLYNLLGIIHKNLHNYEESQNYYLKALEYNSKLPEKPFIDANGNTIDKENNFISTKINIAELHKEFENYNEAIIINEQLLSNKNLLIKYPRDYSIITANLAYSKFLSNKYSSNEILKLFNKSYKISDSLNYKYEVTAIGNYLSEFYLAINQKDSALKYLKKSYSLSKNLKNNTELLRSLKLLSNANYGEKGKKYLYEYIKLNDSLLNEERIMQNKFARIQFETDEVIAENKKITKDRFLLFIITCLLFVGALLIYIIYSQRLKNKQLLFESKQQKANEDIYSLMLSQQSKLEEGRNNERQRISEDLHDGILGKLFGIRVGLEFILIKNKINKKFKERISAYIKEIHSTEKEIREISHELKDGETSFKINFKSLIEHYLKTQSELHLFNYTLKSNSKINWDNVNDKLKVNLYRIIQETIYNVVKHANADSISIELSQINGILILVIKDDGNGFDTKKIKKGIGLDNIKSRVENLKGKLTIKSNATNGTSITVKVPL